MTVSLLVAATLGTLASLLGILAWGIHRIRHPAHGASTVIPDDPVGSRPWETPLEHPE